MIRTTRAQREALFRIFQRDFPGWITPTKRIRNPELYQRDKLPESIKDAQHFAESHPEIVVKVPTIQYRRFRAKAQPYYDGSGCVMIPFAGMWLGIETDGYTHS